VLNLWRNGANRELNWNWLNPDNRWNRNCLFAGVRDYLSFPSPILIGFWLLLIAEPIMLSG